MMFCVLMRVLTDLCLKNGNMTFYYIDMSILLENIPLVKFIKTTSGTRVVYFP